MPRFVNPARWAVALGLVAIAVLGAPRAHAAPRRDPAGSTLRLVAPLEGEKVAEPVARLEALVPAGARDARVVMTRERFDPSTWTTMPTGPEWIVAPYGPGPLAVGALGIGLRSETVFWWAVVTRDPRTGALAASEVRSFTLEPRFANRVAPPFKIEPSARGALPADAAPETHAGRRSGRPIELTAGYTIVPGGPTPALPADLVRAGAAAPPSRSGRSAYLVQFGDDSPDSARARITRAGGTVVSPMSGTAFLVRLSDDARGQLTIGTGSPGISLWEPAYKLSPQIDRSATGPVDLTALLFDDGDGPSVAAALTAFGATGVDVRRSSVNHLARFTVDPSRLADVAALADVAWIEPSPRDSLLNDQAEWVVQTNVPGSRRIWDQGLRGQGQVLMTSDSGIRTNHEMFFDPAVDITDFGDYPSHRKIIAYKRGSDDPGVAFGDDVGANYHGTHTAGTVAGNCDATSTAPYDGMAKDAKLYFIDLSGPGANTSILVPPDLNDLFRPSYEGNAGGAARISSNSWGSSVNGAYTLESMEVDQFMWAHPDYLICYANGNNQLAASVGAPATAKNCLSVGGTGNGTQRTSIYLYESRGPTKDLRRKPTICAPADLVTSSIGSTRYAYATYSGTSMATPAAAGALALAREYLTEGWYPTGTPVAANAFDPSAALLKAMAVNSGDNDVLGYQTPDNNVGWGRIDLDNVLYFPGDSLRTLLIDETNGLMDKQYVEYQVQVTDATRPLKISLVWTDAPGNPAAATQLVNDLDLIVTNGSTSYLGNRVLNNVSHAGGARDSVNVEEGFRLPTPAPGLTTVRVEGHRVPVGPQPFAICITGGVGAGTGSVALDRFEYALDDTLAIEVLDTNATGPLPVTVSSPTDPYGEIVTLNGANGVFRGTLPIHPTTPVPHDGKLAVSSGDVITVTYTDVSPAMNVSATARVNVQPPVITAVHARPLSPGHTLVTWTTDLSATSRVRFGSGASLGTVVDSSGYVTQHAVLLSGLAPGQAYRYDVESATRSGSVARDSLGGTHRMFTAKTHGDVAIVMPNPHQDTSDTWTNALAALGWDADVLTGSDADPPLAGNATSGLRSYGAVLWQVDRDAYPPLSDAQRSAIDSLLEGGGRMLITGHDIGWGLSDAGSPSYSPEREAWIESGLKTRYYYDLYGASKLYGVPGDPLSGAWANGMPYYQLQYYDAGDEVGPAPGTDGVGVANWADDNAPQGVTGLRWESNAAEGSAGSAFWGGQKSRLVGLYYEWQCLASPATANAAGRTAVLENSVDWMLGHGRPAVHIVSPNGGEVVSADYLPIRYTITPDSGRVITNRSLYYSLDGGESWNTLDTHVYADSGYIWDLGGALGGPKIPNSTRVLLRLTATDDGTPMLRGADASDAVFTITRAAGDLTGPVAVAGSMRATPMPMRHGGLATLHVSFSDAETGGGHVAGGEFSWGPAPAAPGKGTPMTLGPDSSIVDVSIDVPTWSLPVGTATLWARARDAAGNWGAAAALGVNVIGAVATWVGDAPAVDFMAPASPNPFRGATTIRFGLSRSGAVRLELFDLSGRRVRTLADAVMAPGEHVASWDGRDDHGMPAASGVYFLRLVTPANTYNARIVALH